MVVVKASIAALRVAGPASRPTVLIGPYRIESLVVESGFARIHKAVDIRSGTAVAVKVFHPARSNRKSDGYSIDQWRRRFLEEARLLASIDHPNVIPVLEAGGEDGEAPWFAMPWMVANLRREIGRDIRTAPVIANCAEHERPRALAPHRGLEVLRQLASALAALHQRGFVHRDVKPTNLLLSSRQDGMVRLCDLGMIKAPNSEMSRAGVWVGTPNYMAPEQREDASGVTDRADVYSAGVLGYRMLVGVLPAGAFEPAHKLVSGVPVALGGILQHAMAPDAGNRPTAGELSAALAAIQIAGPP